MTINEFAPAKVNLTLHVTGRRPDGYHELDSLVMFANIGDRITVEPADKLQFSIRGPMGHGLPEGDDNLVVKAAKAAGISAKITLEKHLPAAAGLGGGSSDAAATLRALEALSGSAVQGGGTQVPIGADVQVCMAGRTARMRGIGDQITPIDEWPALHAVLVNPNLPVMTAEVFRRLKNPENAPMPQDLPKGLEAADLVAWLGEMRNDLEAPAIEAEPVIAQVFAALEVTPGCQLARMSGSGGTCFGLYQDAETAAAAAGRLQETYPGWWVAATELNAKNQSTGP